MQIGIISSSFSNEIVKHRADMLSIHKCHVGRESKIDILNQWMKDEGISCRRIRLYDWR